MEGNLNENWSANPWTEYVDQADSITRRVLRDQIATDWLDIDRFDLPVNHAFRMLCHRRKETKDDSQALLPELAAQP